MQTEKRDFLIHFAMRGRSRDGYLRGNEQCQIIAVRNIEGFQAEKPNINLQSYPEKMIAWNYQQDVATYFQPLVYASTAFGTRIKSRDLFINKYPCQITDWRKELRYVQLCKTKKLRKL